MIHFILFQGRMGRKGFPGKVGPEGVTVNKNNTYTLVLSHYRKCSIKFCKQIKAIHLSLQGESGATGNVGTMGERVRNPNFLKEVHFSLNMHTAHHL